MTTLRNVLLTLALFALLIATAFVRNAVAGQGAAAVASAPVQTPPQSHYFMPVAPAVPPSGDAARPGLLPSAAVGRQFTREAAFLRARVGLPSMDPVASAAIFPAHAANRLISLEAARTQAPRVAAARGLNPNTVLMLVNQYTERFPFGGEAQVNLPMLNRALDDLE